MSIENRYEAIKKNIAKTRDTIKNNLEPNSIEDSLYKDFTVWFSKLSYKPKFLLIGINPGAGYYNNTGVKFRDIDLDPSDVFEYSEYGGMLADETIEVFRSANYYDELEKSVKLNIHYLATSNQKDLFKLQGILLDKYQINMYEKAKEWTMQLIELVSPACIICEGAYPSKRLSEYYNRKIEWENNVCEYKIPNDISVIGYRRFFSKIINKRGLAQKILNI